MESEDLNARALPRGSLLWHYTDFAGLKGIMEGAFRASSLRFLNDTEEFRHGVKVAMEVLQQEMAKARVQSGYDHFGTVYEEVLEFFNDKFEPTNVFVASLSTERDDLRTRVKIT